MVLRQMSVLRKNVARPELVPGHFSENEHSTVPKNNLFLLKAKILTIKKNISLIDNFLFTNKKTRSCVFTDFNKNSIQE